ncbi:chemokine-like factor [Pogoniulus pusillus]|uniref:chemokine-like factor n=1 Tax=Pogoniulus pusillus TaxID=488313 RepID=UPI0030B91FAF
MAQPGPKPAGGSARTGTAPSPPMAQPGPKSAGGSARPGPAPSAQVAQPGPRCAGGSARRGRARSGAMALLNTNFPCSARGALKLTRTVMALVALVCFVVSRSRRAFTALAAMEAIITALFFLLYLLKLDRKLRWFFWPLADMFNSVIAALFLLIVCLFAVIIKTNNGTLAGGVFGLILFVLCIVDAVLLFKKISFGRSRGRNAAAK